MITVIKSKYLFGFVIFAVVLGGVFLLSSRLPKKSVQNDKIHVVASFYPISYVANAVGGDFVTVRNLVPAGVEPHDFEPSTRDLVEVGSASALIYNGASLEPWIKKWSESNTMRPKNVIDMADELKHLGVNLIENNGAVDPHFWLDPIILKKETEIVRDLFTKIDPIHKDFYGENASRLLSELDSLDQHFQRGLSSCSLRDIVVLHKAFDYLARQYGFSAISIEGISPDEEPSPKNLTRIITLARSKHVSYIFSETVASPKFSELIAREIGGKTIVLNPIEGMTQSEVQLGEDYISTMEKNLNNLRKAMICN